MPKKERLGLRRNSRLNNQRETSMRCYIFTLDDCGRTLKAQEIDCNNAEEALQLGSAAVANDPVEVLIRPPYDEWSAALDPRRSRRRALKPAMEMTLSRKGRGAENFRA
ncbi:MULTISPECIES: hypothetical protein [unclassified Bradyrhizobium]|uniref:hypothetical protein n=1 Tax=unclassified Bradyrhizobium TaxID=2631580 RepID=UPI000A881161|nr:MULTISPECIES: hypothetical protein [unclassified Bradyrhizobium]